MHSRATHSGSSNDYTKQAGATSRPSVRAEQPAALLTEVLAIFDEYGPNWYPRELHDRAKQGLRDEGAQLVAVLGEFHELLQKYAPVWYTKQLDEKLAGAIRDLRETGGQLGRK